MKRIILIIFLASGMQQAMAQAPRKVLIEEFTGAWCGNCPEMISNIDAVRTMYPANVIAVACHGPTSSSPYYEPMANNFTMALSNSYHVAGYPSVMVDRADWSSLIGASSTPQLFGIYTNNHNYAEDAVALRLNVSSPVSIDIVSSYDSTTRLANITVTANFVDTASGDMRIICLLVEDKVIGNYTYSQSNYAGHGCDSPVSSSEFYNYPCEIPTSLTGNVFYHKNVTRINLAPIWGTTGVVPFSNSAGEHYSKTYSHTLPSAWNAANMKVVAFIGYYNSGTGLGGEVLNAQEVVLGQTTTAVAENPSAINTVYLAAAYPNPFSQITNIKINTPATQQVSVKVYDTLGHEVATLTDEKLSPGEHTLYWDGNSKEGSSLASGLYLIRLQTEKQSLARSIVLDRN